MFKHVLRHTCIKTCGHSLRLCLSIVCTLELRHRLSALAASTMAAQPSSWQSLGFSCRQSYQLHEGFPPEALHSPIVSFSLTKILLAQSEIVSNKACFIFLICDLAW